MEVYVDDIVVKHQKGSSLITNLEEAFNNLKQFSIKLNPKKSTFGVP
jgi:hypothetical protein